MSLAHFDRKKLISQLLDLMDEVHIILKYESDVDSFLDKTKIFDEWEAVLPEREFPIFIMTVLNNIRRDTIINSIISAILDKGKNKYVDSGFDHNSNMDEYKLKTGDHPFN
tara:strand:+ start:451 stop:783 length:333 start_codon:yes stop_codon:yes gene_type:complete